jgi:predicted secreted protein
MKKIIILSAFISSLLFAESEFSFSKTFERKIKPDTLSSQIQINTSKFSQEETVNRLTKFSDFIESQKHLKLEGGSYSVNPNNIYDNKTQKYYLDGYIGNIGYTISSKEPKELNKFIRELQKVDNNKQVSVSISSVSWKLSESQKNGKSDELRMEAFKWGNAYAKELTAQLSKECSVKKVAIDVDDDSQPLYAGRGGNIAPSMSADSAPTPINEVKYLSINPSFTMVCK